jgi:hypothetical protein
VAKVEEGSPLIQGNASVGNLRLDKGTKGIQSIRGDTLLDNHFQERHNHFLIQGTMSALSIELKTKLCASTTNERKGSSVRDDDDIDIDIVADPFLCMNMLC